MRLITPEPLTVARRTTALAPDVFWQQEFLLQEGARLLRIPLTNFAGRNYPTLFNNIMAVALNIQPDERVVDVGGGDSPFARADVVTDAFPEDGAHRSGRKLGEMKGRQFVQCFAESMPFADGEFDVAICRMVLEHTIDPAKACQELQRVARRGFIETPSPLNEILGGHPTHRWLVRIERPHGGRPTLVFRRRPFVRAPLRYVLRGLFFTDQNYRLAWEILYRNLSCTQLMWEGHFDFRVEPDAGFDYDDPLQAAESHLDTVLSGLRFGGVPMSILLPDADIALSLRPDWAIAHNARGCVLWRINRFAEANAAFREAARLEPDHVSYTQNAALDPEQVPEQVPMGMGVPADADGPRLVLLDTTEESDPAVINFAGPCYHAGDLQTLLQEWNVSSNEQVLHFTPAMAVRKSLPEAAGRVDRLCCRHVLQRVSDPAALCRELQRMAKRGFLETPSSLGEALNGDVANRWLVDWEADTRTLVFRSKPVAVNPFGNVLAPLLEANPDLRHAYETTYRNLFFTQATWEADNPFHVRVEDESGLVIAEKIGAAAEAIVGAVGGLAVAGKAAVNDLDSAAVEAVDGAMMAVKSADGRNPQTTPKAGALVWHAPLFDPSGYADEARHFLLALEAAGYPMVAREIRWSQKRIVLPADRERLLLQATQRAMPPQPVQVCHIFPDLFQRNSDARANIGRTMYETDRLPDGWAAACNTMDAIWVPSAFNRQTFTQAGVQADKIAVVPGTIDFTPYRPDCAPLRIDGARGFNFLSVFDWTLRKGWDALLHAYVEEFRADEDVALLIKTHSSHGYTTQQIVDQITHFLTRTLGRDPNRIADIILQDANVPDACMPNLYRAGDCYVMPTRGEGWGRPFMEAMAMALPTIGTNWSGQTAFMTPENSLLVDCELVIVPEAALPETPRFRGHQWAEPSIPHLRQAMRRVFEDRKGGREIGQRARAHLEAHFSYAAVAQILLGELERWT